MKPLLFIHIPKTGGSSIVAQREIAIFKDNNAPSHQFISEISDRNKFYTFSFVRNPYDKIYSAYSYCKRNDSRAKVMGIEDKTFEQFIIGLPDEIESRLFVPQHKFVTIWGEVAVDAIGKFETLQEDWERITWANNKLPMENISEGVGWAKWTQEMKDIVYDRYKKDFELFGYDE